MKKLIILGGANCQLSAFRRARERGIKTVLFDMREDAPARSIADELYTASTFDIDACLTAARSAQADGVMTLGTDQPVYTAAKIAAELSLPSLLDPETALAVTNKAVMKDILTQAGIPTAQYQLLRPHEPEQLKIQGELVVKPLDNQGQKGVFRCKDADDLQKLAARTLEYSRLDTVLVEEFYPSKELTVSAWVSGGEPQILTVTDRLTFEHSRHIGICSGHRFPSLWGKGWEKEISDLIFRITAAFCIPEGPLYVQLLLGGRGIIVNELACRIGGAFEDCFIPYLTGFDILGAVIDSALGQPVPRPKLLDPAEKQVRVLMPYARPEILGELTPPALLEALPFVKTVGFNFSEGQSPPAFENSGSRLAHAVLFADNEAEMTRNFAEFNRLFYARNNKGENMLLPTEW